MKDFTKAEGFEVREVIAATPAEDAAGQRPLTTRSATASAPPM